MDKKEVLKLCSSEAEKEVVNDAFTVTERFPGKKCVFAQYKASDKEAVKGIIKGRVKEREKKKKIQEASQKINETIKKLEDSLGLKGLEAKEKVLEILEVKMKEIYNERIKEKIKALEEQML